MAGLWNQKPVEVPQRLACRMNPSLVLLLQSLSLIFFPHMPMWMDPSDSEYPSPPPDGELHEPSLRSLPQDPLGEQMTPQHISTFSLIKILMILCVCSFPS